MTRRAEDATRAGTVISLRRMVAVVALARSALAMVAAARGYKFVAVMTETFSIERRKAMRAYGAKVILTPAAARGTGMVEKAKELAEKHGWFWASQFTNPANPAYHRSTTATEILRDFAGQRLDYFVSGWGSGGTLTGTITSQRGDQEISEGKISGDELSFVTVREGPNGQIKIAYKGKVSGNEIRLTREMPAGMGGGQRGGGGGGGGRGPQEIVLKRAS